MTYDRSNIFAKIIRGEIPAKKIYEDEQVLAIVDIAPAAPMHVLVMPKDEYISFDDFAAHASPDAIVYFFKVLGAIAKELGVCETGYRLIANHGTDASQSVPHFHMHILGGRPLGGLLADDSHLR